MGSGGDVADRGEHTSPAPLGLIHHVIAVACAGLVAMAARTALLFHLGLAPLAASGGAAFVFLGLVVLHLVLQPRAHRKAPALGSERTRKIRPMAEIDRLAARPAVAEGFPAETLPRSAALVATEIGAADVSRVRDRPAAMMSPLQAEARRSHAEGFEQLQGLVAQLARSTPGPKATTPDPDAPRGTPHAATFQQSYAEAMERANDAQAAALAHAARVMATTAPFDELPSQSQARGVAAELVDALAADRMTIYLEPIQQIEFGRPRHYEVSVRFKAANGSELPHKELLAAARDAGLLPRVDAAVLPRAARIAQHFQLRGRDTDIVSRVHGVSLTDQQFRAEVAAATIATDGAALVLSFAQSDIRVFGPIHWEILSTIAEMGLRFAIESVTDLDMDFETLKRRGFGFVKLDATVLLDGLPAAGGMIASADVCRHFSTLGLALVVNHIDDEQALARVLGFGVLFGQGTLFGGPRAVRSDLLTSATAA